MIKNTFVIMSLNLIQIFGSILIVVALITSLSLFGNSDQYSFLKTPSKSLSIQTKTFVNPIISNQFSISKLFQNPVIESEVDPEIAWKASRSRGVTNPIPITLIGQSLPDDYDLSSLYCGPGMRCL